MIQERFKYAKANKAAIVSKEYEILPGYII